MAATAKKSTKSTETKKTASKTTKTTKTTVKADAPQIRQDINPAASWPFPVYTKS